MKPPGGASRPDFVMVGGQEGGKFFLLASKSLTEVELRMERDRLEYHYTWPQPWGTPRHFVTAEMRDYVMVIGDSYAEAFRTLFEEWTPEPDPRRAIGEQPAIEAARPAITGPDPKAIGR